MRPRFNNERDIPNGFLVGFGGSGEFNLVNGTVQFAGSGIIGSLSTGNGIVNQSGGIVTATGTGHITLGRDAGAIGTYNMTGGSLQTLGVSELYIGDQGQGAMNQSGGNIIIAGSTFLGLRSAGVGYYNISGDAYFTTNLLRIGHEGPGIFQMDGGTAYTPEIVIAGHSGVNATLSLSGGSLSAGSISFGEGNGQFNFTGGTLQVDNFVGDLVNQGGRHVIDIHGDGIDTISGNYALSPDAVLAVETSAFYFPQLGEYVFDSVSLQVNGIATLGGSLENVFNLTPFGPTLDPSSPNFFFEILTASGGIIGEFDEAPPTLVGFDSEGDAYGLVVKYFSDSVYLVSEPVAIAGDYNSNGIVDAGDYTVWRDSLNQSGSGLLADGDNNGVVNTADYDIWANNFGLLIAVLPPQGAAAIPEPSLLALLFCGLYTLTTRRRAFR